MNKEEMLDVINHQGRIKFLDIRPGDTVLWFRRKQAVISEVLRMVGRDMYWINTAGNPINPEGREFYLIKRPSPDLMVLPVFSVIRFKNHSGVAAVGMKDEQGNWNIIDTDGNRYHGSSRDIMNQQARDLEVMS